MEIEVFVIDFLSALLSVPVYAERPIGNIPAKYVIVEKTGSGVSEHIEQATMAVQSYGPTKAEALQLNTATKNAMARLVECPEISAVERMSDYPFPSLNTKEYRYQAVFEITHY